MAGYKRFYKFFLSEAVNIKIDKQGSFLIASNLRKEASIEKEVVIFGVETRIEFLSKE